MNETVCVIMSTYNGKDYVVEQIESLLRQKNVQITIFVRDDGSKDNTVAILEGYRDKGLTIESGENCGAKVSFLKALRMAPDADYYAFSDQDDVWDDDKLIVAVEAIKAVERENPDKCVLYAGTTRSVDRDLVAMESIKYSGEKTVRVNGFLKGKPRNAAGCTMVFNRKLKELISLYMPQTFPMHDAWLNNVCMAVGGVIVHDPIPHMSYRQHGNNVVGGKRGLLASVKRRIAFYKKMGKCYHTKMLKEIFDHYGQYMPEDNVKRYQLVAGYRDSFRNKVLLLKDKDFFKGDFKHRIESRLLVLFNVY